MQNYPDPTAVAADLNGPFYAPNNGQQQQQQAQQPQQQQHMQQPPQQQQPNVQQEQHQDQRISNPEQQLAQHAVELSGMASQMAPQDYKPMMQNRADGTQSPQPAHQNMPFQHEQQMMGADMGHGSVDHSQEAFGTPGDGQAPRKRSKVSRACDECRRKKIRCDATSEGPNASCTSCKRMGAACQFSRVPMKRGPSKGYIKELADRLNQLEGAIQGSPSGEHVHYPQQNVDMSRRQSQDFSPPPGPLDTPSIGRKRGYSSVTQDFSTPGFPQQTTHRQSGQWSQMDMPRQTPNQFAHAAPEQYRPVFSPNGLAPQAQFPVGRDPRLTMDNSFSPDGMNLNDRLEIDDAVLDEYYRTIHSTLPVLPWKDALFERLSRCSAPVANALLLSLLAVVNSFNGNYNLIDTRKASSAVSLCMQDDFAQAKQFGDSRVVLLSAVTLMAIDAGLRSNNAGSQSSFLGQALAVAKDLGLYGFQYDGRLSPDSDEYLLRRIWISLAILDRCHSAAWSVPLLISESSFVLYAEDEETLGSELYYTARKFISRVHFEAATKSLFRYHGFPRPDCLIHHFEQVVRSRIPRLLRHIDEHTPQRSPYCAPTNAHLRDRTPHLPLPLAHSPPPLAPLPYPGNRDPAARPPSPRDGAKYPLPNVSRLHCPRCYQRHGAARLRRQQHP